MKRFWTHIVIFLSGCILVYLPAVWIAGISGMPSNVNYVPGNYGHMGLRMAEADSLSLSQGPDLLFIGSSHCYRTFDTRVYDSAGFHSFNLGSSNQTPKQSLMLLKRYAHRWPLQMAVIEVHPDIMGNSGVESAIDILSNCDADGKMALEALGMRNIRVTNTLLCSKIDRMLRGKGRRQDSGVVHIKTTDGDEEKEVDFTYIQGGFVEVTPLCFKPTQMEPKTIEIRDDQLQALAECMQTLDELNIRYLLVEVPSTRCRYQSYTNHDEFEAKIRSLVKHDHEYINLNEDSHLTALLDDSTCFYDDDHLNLKGAEILNRHLKLKIGSLVNGES